MKWQKRIHNITEDVQTNFERFDKFISRTLRLKDHSLSAEFGNPSEILSKGKGIITVDGIRSISLHDSLMGFGCFGQTGSGKSSVVINNLLLSDTSISASYFVYDPARPIFNQTSGAMQKKGVKVKVIDLANADASSGINIFPESLNSTAIAQQVDAALRSTLGNGGPDKFWYLASSELLILLCSLVFGLDKKFHHWPQITAMLDILAGEPELFDKFVVQFCPKEKYFTQYKGHISAPEKTRQSIILNCKAALKIFTDQNVARVLSHSDIRFEDLQSESTIIYLVNDVASQSYYSGVNNMIFTSFFSKLLAHVPDPISTLPIMVILDESSSLNLGRPQFSNYLNSVRKHHISVSTFWQDVNQIKDIYGEGAKAILAGLRNKLWIPAGMELSSAEILSRTLGEYEYETEQGGVKKRLLRTPFELMQYPPNRGIFISQHHPPFELDLYSFYKQRKNRERSQTPTPQNLGSGIPKEVPLFDFNTLKE